MLSARSSTTNLSSSTDSGILPNLEYKLNQTSRGRSKSSVLKDGLQFIAYGAQAIAQVNASLHNLLNVTLIFFLFKGRIQQVFYAKASQHNHHIPPEGATSSIQFCWPVIPLLCLVSYEVSLRWLSRFLLIA